MRATEVRSDSGLRPRASWDHHCSARWLTVREARAPELLKGAALALVDPGTTAAWEMRLDEVVTGRVQFKGVIDEIAAEAAKLIAVLRQHTGALVDLSRPAAIAARRGETTDGLLHSRRRRPCATFDVSNCNNLRMMPRNYRHRARAPAPPGARLGAGNGGVARSIRPDGALSLPRSGLWSHGHPRPSCAARRAIRPRRGRGHRSRPASHLVHGRRLDCDYPTSTARISRGGRSGSRAGLIGG